MRILLTNDDGIRAPGIMALRSALLGAHGRGPFTAGGHKLSSLLTVAPLTVQSATSHGVTFHEPLMVEDVELPRTGAFSDGVVAAVDAGLDPGIGIAVDGRPADCVKLAVSSLWPERFGAGPDGRRSRPDLLISGMNAGANCGINVIYSGTVAAAIEGAFLGVPSIAVSMMLGKGKPRFDIGALRARHALEKVLAAGPLKPYECISINVPVTEDPALTPDSPMPAVHVCPMNIHGLVDKYERRESPSGNTYYWAAGYGLDFHGTDPGSDVDHLLKGDITVTPLKFDLTKHEALQMWRGRLG